MIGQLVAYRPSLFPAASGLGVGLLGLGTVLAVAGGSEAFVERGDARFLVSADRADYVDRIPYPVSASAMTGRKSLSAIPDSPIPVLWNVEKR